MIYVILCDTWYWCFECIWNKGKNIVNGYFSYICHSLQWHPLPPFLSILYDFGVGVFTVHGIKDKYKDFSFSLFVIFTVVVFPILNQEALPIN